MRRAALGVVAVTLCVTWAACVGSPPRGSSADVEKSKAASADSVEESQTRYADVPHSVKECTIETGNFVVVGDLILPAEAKGAPIIVFVWGAGPAGREKIRRPSPLLTVMLEAGFGVFIEDKPGTGASTGEFTPGRLLSERAGILTAEIAYLRTSSDAGPSAVGVYGSSQAGYVVGLALDGGAKLDFLVAVSCPAMSSDEQSAYLVEQQLLCAGYAKDESAMARRFFVQRHRAQSYSEYLEAALFLDSIPVVQEDLGWAGIVPEKDFVPPGPDSEDFYDPSQAIAGLRVPVIALFGEKDTQVDPRQGAEVYSGVVRSFGSALSRVVTLPGVDHNMRVSKTGCLKEQRERYGQPGGTDYAPEFLESIEKWLVELGAYLSRAGRGATPSN